MGNGVGLTVGSANRVGVANGAKIAIGVGVKMRPLVGVGMGVEKVMGVLTDRLVKVVVEIAVRNGIRVPVANGVGNAAAKGVALSDATRVANSRGVGEANTTGVGSGVGMAPMVATGRTWTGEGTVSRPPPPHAAPMANRPPVAARASLRPILLALFSGAVPNISSENRYGVDAAARAAVAGVFIAPFVAM